MLTRQGLPSLSALALMALLAAAPPAAAAARFVTNTNDSGAGSLRVAVSGATASDVVVFDAAVVGKTITLTTGPILVDKNLAIVGTRITVSGNKASRVFEVSATVTISGLTIRDGYADSGSPGGGIHNTGNLTLVDSTVTENVSTVHGGGIGNNGTLTVARTTISGNVARDSYGGGIGNYAGGTLVIQNGTISGNVAGQSGGGIDNWGGAATVIFSTIAHNFAAGSGGGINGADSPDAVTLLASILARNASPAGPDCIGSVESGDHNLVGRTDGCAFTGTTTNNILNQDPLLGSLQRNGGPVRTHSLRPGSPAMEKVPTATCTTTFSTTNDARGLGRPQDGDANGISACDIGAYEAKTPIVVNSLADLEDPTKCTLRSALFAAQTNTVRHGCAAGTAGAGGVAPDRIVFGVTGRIVTAYGFGLGRGVLIDGPGAAALTIAGTPTGTLPNPLLELWADETDAQEDVFVVAGLTIADGSYAISGLSAPGDEGHYDTLAIDRVSFVDNRSADFYGGALYIGSLREAEIDASSFATSTGGGGFGWPVIEALNVPLTMRNTTIGAIAGGNIRTALYARSTLGVPARVRLVGCTLHGSGAGAGVKASGDTIVTYQSSVFAGHADGELLPFDGASFVSLGYNIIGDQTGAPAATGDLKGTDPRLGLHLWGHGGTPAMAPRAGSPVVDHVPYEKCGVFGDQRGAPRPLDGNRDGAFACDVGAFETAPPIVVNSLLDTGEMGTCRLRDAIAAANTNAAANGCPAGLPDAPDLVTFDVTGTIALQSALLPTGSAFLRGPGATKLTIGGASPLPYVIDLSGATSHFALSGVTITGYGIGDVGANGDSSLGIAESVFRNNATEFDGAVFTSDVPAVQISRSTIVDTTGDTRPQIAVVNGDALIESSTVSDTAGTAVRLSANGLARTAHMRLKGSTIRGTGATGVLAQSSFNAVPADAVIDYRYTIVFGHTANFDLSDGAGVSLGYNLSAGGSGNLVAEGDREGFDPGLGPLGYHGGETPVFNLLPASASLNRIPAEKCGPGFDQRGFARPFGATCDIGAVERRPGGDVNGNGVYDVADVFSLINFLFAAGAVPVGEPDVNGDGDVTVADVFYMINDLFAGGPDPV